MEVENSSAIWFRRVYGAGITIPSTVAALRRVVRLKRLRIFKSK